MIEKKDSLPVEKYREQIAASVKHHAVTLIMAETGAGKSTQVPKFLLEAGYKVIVTQPRRLAAVSLATRVAEEIGCEIGTAVGYRTGHERASSKDTRLLFCTDGLQLVRELTGNGVGSDTETVLVLDEVHEWNLNLEILLGFVKSQQMNGQNYRVVLMSATVDAEKLNAYFGSVHTISVPGRLFPVKWAYANEKALFTWVNKLAREGKNVLVFQPGVKEMNDLLRALEGLDAELLPLHGNLEAYEQARCFEHYSRPKVVVATNVAQTSITIDDINAVVDCGLEKKPQVVHGVEGLYLRPISQADCRQRAGRAGRCGPGEYVLCADILFKDREEFPSPEISYLRLDQVVLRLAASGLDASTFPFFHEPNQENLVLSKEYLVGVGALTAGGVVTEVGKLMANLPLTARYARMVVEATKRNVVADVVKVVAILEAGSLRDKNGEWQYYTREDKSDLLVELDLYEEVRGLRPKDMEKKGVNPGAYFASRQIMNDILHTLRANRVAGGTSRSRKDVLLSCAAGMVDQVYQHKENGWYENKKGVKRKKSSRSAVAGEPDYIVGLPRDIEVGNNRPKSILEFVSVITPEQIAELVSAAPVQTYSRNATLEVVRVSRIPLNGVKKD
jgi:ATP-dependent helicase HrpA